MKQNAVVKIVDGEYATVSVLREEACSHCAGRVVCGTAKTAEVRVKNPVSAAVGDTVVIETPSQSVLAYSALVFLAPVALAVLLYVIFSEVNKVLMAVMPICGFILPFIIALLIDRKNRDARMPAITEILNPPNETPACDEGKGV